MPTVLTYRVPPPPLSCLPRVSSLLILVSACRDGDEPHFGRPGGWEVGCRRQRREPTYVCLAGKVTQLEI